MTNVVLKFQENYNVDPRAIPVFSRDNFRVDVGLMIQRPPIFMQMKDRDFQFMKARSEIMNEYYCNMKQFIAEHEEVATLNENILADNSYASEQNLDNFPTHEFEVTNPDGTTEVKQYAAASKNFAKVDPRAHDRRSLHYAGEDRVYLLLKNKYTGEWEFPTGRINFGQTFLRAKQNLFLQYSEGKNWKVKHFGTFPSVHTLRDFTEAEKDSDDYISQLDLKGVRTCFFGAHHYRGLPEMNFDFEGCHHEDHAWVPKR